MNFYRKTYHLLKLANRSKSLVTKSFMLTQQPIRMVHQRGYNEYYDNWTFIFHEINLALGSCKNTENFIFVFKKYEKYMTDVQMAFAFRQIAVLQLERSKDFWEIIVPRVKKQLATLDRNCTRSLYAFIEGASAMTLQDNEFWELVEQKLVDEGLHRYFEL